MVLVLSALTSAAFGTGVIVGLAIGGPAVACVYAVERLVGSGRKSLQAPGQRREKSNPGGVAGRRPSPPYSRETRGRRKVSAEP